MPHLRIETNVPQEKMAADLPQRLCKIVGDTLGKPASFCAATVVGGVNMAMAGNSKPTAQATLMSIGGLGVEANKRHSKAIGDAVEKELGVPKDRMYIHFINAAGGDVGYNGTTCHGFSG